MSGVPVHGVSWSEGAITTRPIPPEGSPVINEGVDASGNLVRLGFLDNLGNVFTAALNGRGEVSVHMVAAGKQTLGLAQEYRSQITTAVKVLGAVLLGASEAGSKTQDVGNALFAVSGLSDVLHYGHSGIQTYRQQSQGEPWHRGLTTATFKDLGKAVGQASTVALGLAAIFKPGDSIQRATYLAGGVGAVATGLTVQEEKRERKRDRDAFYANPLAHLSGDLIRGGTTHPLGSGDDTTSTTTPQTTRVNTGATHHPTRADAVLQYNPQISSVPTDPSRSGDYPPPPPQEAKRAKRSSRR